MNLRERIKKASDDSARETEFIKKNAPWIERSFMVSAALLAIMGAALLIIGQEKAMGMPAFNLILGLVFGSSLAVMYIRSYIFKIWGASQ